MQFKPENNVEGSSEWSHLLKVFWFVLHQTCCISYQAHDSVRATWYYVTTIVFSEQLGHLVNSERIGLFQENINIRANQTCMIKRISTSLFGSCLPEPGKFPGKPLIALPDHPNGPIYRLLVGMQSKELSHWCRWEDNCSHYKRHKIFVILRVAPYHGWYRNHSYTVKFSTGIPIYRGHNSQNRPIPILVYGKQD